MLLDSREGPVGRHVQRRADDVLVDARRRGSVILANANMDLIIEERHVGENSVEIGLFSDGRFSRYLAEKDAREQNIFRPAILNAGFFSV